MTTISVSLQAGASPRHAGHFGAWRALTAVPAMIGSLLLLLVLFGWMGEWEGAVLLRWIGSGAAVCSRVGERVAVRVGAGFRRPTKAHVALLSPAWTAALARAGLTASEVDLYVQLRREPNAFAAGGRSVAVTTGVLAKFRARRLGEEYLVAILTHDPLTAPVTVMPEIPAA
jgi:STE24 endopeptidase